MANPQLPPAVYHHVRMAIIPSSESITTFKHQTPAQKELTDSAVDSVSQTHQDTSHLLNEAKSHRPIAGAQAYLICTCMTGWYGWPFAPISTPIAAPSSSHCQSIWLSVTNYLPLSFCRCLSLSLRSLLRPPLTPLSCATAPLGYPFGSVPYDC